ncbi:MAG TPA: hypothetical protein VJP02_02880 [Candidatus Sulfotelmatobacter sp.]|nr:hypothetical protein [Candidatus Sulfotelmatobacter sp.]
MSSNDRRSFKVEPVYLSPEHARHYQRFTGVPYDAEEVARTKAWVGFKNWHHRLQLDAEAPSAEPARPKLTLRKAESTLTSVKVIPLAIWRLGKRPQRTFNVAVERLADYVARRISRGDRVAVLRPPYRLGQVRAVLEVNGKRLRVFYLAERGAWRAA